jgi:hypothetical protein
MLSTLLLVLVLTETPTPAGGVVAPAVLPAASNSVYGVVGAPELGAGYRQGFSVFEVEGRALFNLLELSGLVEGGLKLRVLERDELQLGVGAALGLQLNSGSKYFDVANFASVALRPRVSALVSYAFSPIITGVAQLEVPLSLSLTKLGTDFRPALGAGAEFLLGSSVSLLVLGELGIDAIKESIGVTQVRLAWGVRLGVGYRIF